MAGGPFPRYFAPEMKDLVELEEDGLVEIGSTALEVKTAGRLFLRNIAMAFDRYLRWGQVAEGRFSRTV
jgi:oxygen-independent coproporphyrinogen-3 oxidase